MSRSAGCDAAAALAIKDRVFLNPSRCPMLFEFLTAHACASARCLTCLRSEVSIAKIFLGIPTAKYPKYR